MSMLPHQLEEDTTNPKTRNMKPPAGERLRFAIYPRLDSPSEAPVPAATQAEGTETATAFGITSFSYFLLYPFVGGQVWLGHRERFT
jgi:hypothetical protein